MSIDNDDFFADGLDASGGPQNTQQVIETFNDWVQKTEQAEALELELKALNAEINKIRTERMPALLDEMGTEIWRDPASGLTVELETAVNSSLPKNKDRRNEILDALRPIGVEEILTEEFTVSFSPNDIRAVAVREILGLPQDAAVFEDDVTAHHRLTNEQVSMIQDLREALELGQMPAEEKLGAHPSSFKAWLRRRIDAGEGHTVSEAGIWHGKHAKISKPRRSAGGKK